MDEVSSTTVASAVHAALALEQKRSRGDCSLSVALYLFWNKKKVYPRFEQGLPEGFDVRSKSGVITTTYWGGQNNSEATSSSNDLH